MPEKNMKIVRRLSIAEPFEVCPNSPIPSVTSGGARVKVYYAGACYTDDQVRQSGQRRLRMRGVQDTSLFPGYEVSGVVDEVCPSILDRRIKPGDRVVLYPDCKELTEGGYAEYISVPHVDSLVKIPDHLPLDVASLLPCGGLQAYAAVSRARHFLREKLEDNAGPTNILIVGAGGLALWTLRLAEYYMKDDRSKVRLNVADTSVEKLMLAKEHGCTDIIHWSDAIHEQCIMERTKNACAGGADVVIDFVSSPRTFHRSTHILKEDGVLVVGGNSKYDVCISPNKLANNNQSILGVKRGTRQQLVELVKLVADGEVKPPCFSLYPVDQADTVFENLNQCKIDGRAVFDLCGSGAT